MSVELVLGKHNIDYERGGSYFKIRCLDPDHEDKNPSMFVNEHTGWANCRSCGASYNIFELLNEQANWLQIRKQQFRNKLQQVASDNTYYEFPETAVFRQMGYRGISASTIQKFQAFECSDFPGYLAFPLKDSRGNILNFMGRDTSGDRKSKYVMFYKRPVLMFPVNNSRHGSIILVEGLFDMLNLHQHGLTNARAILGATTFTKETLETLKIESISEVVLMLDGDEAGRKASERIAEMLKENFINTRTVKLAEGTDPGDLSPIAINKIGIKLYGERSSNRDKAEQESV